jgi:hypothetical protein
MNEHDAEFRRKPALSLVQRFYEAGAVQVARVETEDFRGNKISNDLIVTLPTDARARERVFRLQAEVVGSQGYEAEVDVGQQGLYVLVR